MDWRYSSRAARNRRAVLREWHEAIQDGAYSLADAIVQANPDVFDLDHLNPEETTDDTL